MRAAPGAVPADRQRQRRDQHGGRGQLGDEPGEPEVRPGRGRRLPGRRPRVRTARSAQRPASAPPRAAARTVPVRIRRAGGTRAAVVDHVPSTSTVPATDRPGARSRRWSRAARRWCRTDRVLVGTAVAARRRSGACRSSVGSARASPSARAAVARGCSSAPPRSARRSAWAPDSGSAIGSGPADGRRRGGLRGRASPGAAGRRPPGRGGGGGFGPPAGGGAGAAAIGVRGKGTTVRQPPGAGTAGDGVERGDRRLAGRRHRDHHRARPTGSAGTGCCCPAGRCCRRWPSRR